MTNRLEQRLLHPTARATSPEAAHQDVPQRLGQILLGLLAQYQAQFPEVHITLVETSARAAG